MKKMKYLAVAAMLSVAVLALYKNQPIPIQIEAPQVATALSGETKQRINSERERREAVSEPITAVGDLWETLYAEAPWVVDDIFENTVRLGPAGVEQYNALHVIPYNMRITDCVKMPDEVKPAGRLVSSLKCSESLVDTPHPYYDIAQDVLLEMVETGDAEAAAILGDRVFYDRKPQRWTEAELLERLEMMEQAYGAATALSGKPGPLMKLSRNGIGKSSGGENLIYMTAFRVVAEKLGDPRARPDEFIDKINNNVHDVHTGDLLGGGEMVVTQTTHKDAYELSDDWPEQAEESATALLLQYAEIEETTVGTSVMRGAI